ncbi:MAG: EAL domain-containing protein [Pelomonas sp.]|nr:EAL domain-containing protein [Roseateles sp.]
MESADDDLQFILEDEADGAAEASSRWRVLVVDDEEGVHLATRFAFKAFRFAGRGVEFVGAYSGREARALLARDQNFACLLLDVVMESDRAGLDLVHHVRRELRNETVRIILRTGQPGTAPELSVVQDYDINDYREKARATSDQLHTALTAALRGYQQLITIQENRRGLEMVIAASATLLSRQELGDFAAGILTQIGALIHARPDGIVCVVGGRERRAVLGGPAVELEVFAAAGRYASRVARPLEDAELGATIQNVLLTRKSSFGERVSYLYLPVTKLGEIVVIVDTDEPIRELDRKLLELFGINIAIGFDNSFMYREIERLAYVDALTGLPNLNGLERLLGDELGGARSYVLGFADIDHFEVVNDGLGRAIGDRLLIHVGSALDAMPELGVVARVGGDVFAFLFACDALEPAPMLARVSERLKQTIEFDPHAVSVSATIGAVQFLPGSATPATLAANAGVALKAAKRSRQGGYLLFEESMNAELRERLHLTARLDRALAQRDFFLLYQPQVCLATGRLVGVEALVRWRDRGQIVPPDRFIPVAEASGLILPLGRWVLEEAVAQQRAWAAQGLVLRMAVNVASRQLFEDDDLVEHVQALLGAGAPVDLKIEVTESGIVGDAGDSLARLRRIQALGVRVAIDDFGTGYSSLGQLRHLPVHQLKIDRVFIRGIEHDPDDLHIAELIVSMGHRLGLRVLAEGVEDEAQRDILKRLGCDEAQGYLYARPLPPEELAAFAARVGVVGPGG